MVVCPIQSATAYGECPARIRSVAQLARKL